MQSVNLSASQGRLRMSNVSETLERELKEWKEKQIDKDKVTADEVIKSVIKK